MTDIKPENIHYKTKTEDSSLLLTDFAESALLSSPLEINSGPVENIGYAAPEVISQEGRSRPADVWSIGVIAYTLLCGYSPFESKNPRDLYQESEKGIVFHERYWRDISSDAKGFISRILVPEVGNRFTCQVCPTRKC